MTHFTLTEFEMGNSVLADLCSIIVYFCQHQFFFFPLFQVFQPMLMEYFTYEELKDIKKKVIAQHCSQKEAAEFRGLSKWNQAEELQKVFKYSVDEKADQGEASN